MSGNTHRRGPVTFVLGAIAVAAVAVAGLVPAEAQNPRCEALTAAFNSTDSPAIREFIFSQLQASGCDLPTTTTTSSSTTSTSTSTTSTSTTTSTTTSTSTSTTSTTINPNALRCAALLQAFNATTDPTGRAIILNQLAQSGCGGDSLGTT
ncbi:MAG: hypothetical protein M3144_08060 [Actinomycetota bacterium]|nr:hypothetical protein [Actinomycetota bacterium]